MRYPKGDDSAVDRMGEVMLMKKKTANTLSLSHQGIHFEIGNCRNLTTFAYLVRICNLKKDIHVSNHVNLRHFRSYL